MKGSLSERKEMIRVLEASVEQTYQDWCNHMEFFFLPLDHRYSTITQRIQTVSNVTHTSAVVFETDKDTWTFYPCKGGIGVTHDPDFGSQQCTTFSYDNIPNWSARHADIPHIEQVLKEIKVTHPDLSHSNEKK